MRDAGRLPSPPAGVLLISPCTDMSPGCVFLRDDAEARAAGEHDYLPREKLGAALPTAYAPVWGTGRGCGGGWERRAGPGFWPSAPVSAPLCDAPALTGA
jgi:hypothetical protein